MALLVLLASVLSKNAQKAEALRSEAEAIPTSPVISAEDREVIEENKMSLPDEMQETVQSLIDRSLSSGDFSDLDSVLREWRDVYKDSEDQSDDEGLLIDSYRADIANYWVLTDWDNPALDAWLFYNPDALAAATAFAPISAKYLAFLDMDSSALSPADSAINLRKSDKSNEELGQMLDKINSLRTDAGHFPMMAVYNMTLFGSDYEFIAVADNDYMKWRPYSIKPVEPGVKDPTMQMAQDTTMYLPAADLDSIFITAPHGH
jgi:hypothetical protein